MLVAICWKAWAGVVVIDLENLAKRASKLTMSSLTLSLIQSFTSKFLSVNESFGKEVSRAFKTVPKERSPP